MKKNFLLLFFFAISAVFCSGPKGITTPEGVQSQSGDEDEISTEAPQNTFIRGVFISDAVDRDSDVVGNRKRTEAHIKVEEILRAGSNYHGQFHAGDKLKVFFANGWSGDNTGHIPLNPGDTFKAELIESETRITIYNYAKL